MSEKELVLIQMQAATEVLRGKPADADRILKVLDERKRLLDMVIDVYSNWAAKMPLGWENKLVALILDVNDGKEPEMLT